MLQNLREAFINKIEVHRGNRLYCLIRWVDNKELETLEQKYVFLSPSESIRINSTYIIQINGDSRQGTVLVKGSKIECDDAKKRLSPQVSSTASKNMDDKQEDILNDLVLVRILNNLADRVRKRSPEETDEDIHHVQCAVCKIKPLVQTDRYRCLECSTSSSGYDLCGRCFEKRRQSERHQSGHVMVHFKLPKEFLGIEVNSSDVQLNLNQLKKYHYLQNEQHNGVTCDGECRRSNFKGLRFKCDTCPNYNLCERCAIERRSVTKNHHSDHPLILASNKMMPEVSPDDIEFGETLGRGGFGYVCKARWISRNRQIACKVIEVSGFSQEAQSLKQSFLMELAAYRELSGPYIVRTFAYATQHLPASGPRRETDKFMILMEFMHRGSLQNLLEQEPNQISLRRKVTFARQIAAGMRRIHEHGMVHRDIRPDNVLITENYVAKIGDMGITRFLDPAGRHSLVGCFPFMPPEFFAGLSDGRTKYNQKLDIYTYGLTINQLFTECRHDFEFRNPQPRLNFKKTSPIFYEEIIQPCIRNDPERRPTAESIENTLEIYGQAFRETMHSSAYVEMSSSEKNAEFIRFYQKNRSRIQRFMEKQFMQPAQKEVSHKEKSS